MTEEIKLPHLNPSTEVIFKNSSGDEYEFTVDGHNKKSDVVTVHDNVGTYEFNRKALTVK